MPKQQKVVFKTFFTVGDTPPRSVGVAALVAQYQDSGSSPESRIRLAVWLALALERAVVLWPPSAPRVGSVEPHAVPEHLAAPFESRSPVVWLPRVPAALVYGWGRLSTWPSRFDSWDTPVSLGLLDGVEPVRWSRAHHRIHHWIELCSFKITGKKLNFFEDSYPEESIRA